MKKKLSILIIGIIVFSCSKNIEFNDYDYQSIYFPYQSPVRTLILGDESVGDNSIDLEHAFSIGVTMGGAYENKIDRIITIEYAPELGENITDDSQNPIEILPTDYYEADFNQIIIPAGEFSGKMRVELKDAFFQDPMSITTHYIIPVRITDAGNDTVLSGKPSDIIDNPDPRVPDHWIIAPKNYTLFGIKYINETHGMYLLRGARINTATNDTFTYSARFLTDNNMTKLTTLSLTENQMNIVAGTFTGSNYLIKLTFNKGNQTVTVSQKDSTTIPVTGGGVYYTKNDDEAESFNNQKHRTIYIDYSLQIEDETYSVKDSLVFVDTDVIFEQFTVNVIEQGE